LPQYPRTQSSSPSRVLQKDRFCQPEFLFRELPFFRCRIHCSRSSMTLQLPLSCALTRLDWCAGEGVGSIDRVTAEGIGLELRTQSSGRDSTRSQGFEEEMPCWPSALPYCGPAWARGERAANVLRTISAPGRTASGPELRLSHCLNWRTRQDSNLRPLPSEGNALSN
jgi:hypothetical protein